MVNNDRGQVRLLIDVHRGKIAAIADLDPDNGNGLWPELGNQLAGTRYEPDEIRSALDGIQIAASHRTMDAEQLTRAIYCY